MRASASLQTKACKPAARAEAAQIGAYAVLLMKRTGARVALLAAKTGTYAVLLMKKIGAYVVLLTKRTGLRGLLMKRVGVYAVPLTKRTGTSEVVLRRLYDSNERNFFLRLRSSSTEEDWRLRVLLTNRLGAHVVPL